MSQRLADVAVAGSANGYVRKHMSDPYWTTPLGYTKKGRPFYPVAGADGTDGSNGETGGAGGTGTGSGSGSEGGNGSTGTGTGEGATGNDGTKAETVSKAEHDALMERMKAADRNQAATAAKLKELEEKDLSEQEKVLKRVPELEKSVADLTTENKGLKAQVAFLGLEGFSWNDPDIALGQVDLSEVLKDDGVTIDKTKLKKAAEALAKDKPFLCKDASASGAGDGKDGKNGASGNGSGGQGSSGSAAGSGNGGAGSSNAMSEEALRKKYPALN